MSREGSVKKDESGRWFFVIDLTAPGAVKRRQVKRRGFKTKKAALEALDETRRTIKTGTYVEPSKVTVAAYLTETWLPSLRKRPTTVDTYKRLVRVHIIPRLGDIPLQQLDRGRVARWHTELMNAGLSAKSVRNIHGVLSKALGDAVDPFELVARNVAADPRTLPEVGEREPRVWSAAQLQRFLEGTASDRLGTLWRFIAATGCRRGEALGLTWDDVDIDAGTVVITKQRTIAGGSVVEGATKSKAGARTVALDPGTVTALKAWRATQNSERLVMGAGWPRTSLVFTHPDGSGLWPQMVTARFKAAALELGLPAIGVHGLRHSAATFMIKNGVNPRVVQQRLGHAHVAITLSLYTHVLPGHDREAADLLGRALDGVAK